MTANQAAPATGEIEGGKCVIVVNEALPFGLAVNASAVVAFTLGQRKPALIGADVIDANAVSYPGVISIPVPILKAPEAQLTKLLEAARGSEFTVAQLSTLAQSCKAYDEYITKMSTTSTSELTYSAIGIFGPKKAVTRLVGNLPLMR